VFEIVCLLLLQGKFAGPASRIKELNTHARKFIIFFKIGKTQKIKKNAKNKQSQNS
jgi:hypothetical protein